MEPMVLSIDGESEEVSGESTGWNGGAEEAMMVELNFISHPISGIKVKSNCRYILALNIFTAFHKQYFF